MAATFVCLLLGLLSLSGGISATARTLSSSDSDQPMLMHYHNGPLLRGPTAVNLVWYGNFTPSQRAIVADFFSSASPRREPSVSTWWKTTQTLYHAKAPTSSPPLSLSLKAQTLDQGCSLGKSLRMKHIVRLAAKGARPNSIAIVLTAADVAVDGFCSSRCGTHGSSRWGLTKGRFAFIWVGNSAAQCPGLCAWPFHQPIYGPQTPPLVAPNNDVGVDGMVINIATLLAGTVTNPFGNGFFQGPAEAPLEAASACAGVYGKGAYPGYPGELLIDPTTGASYNAEGISSRKYLLPALFDPSTSKCSTLV